MAERMLQGDPLMFAFAILVLIFSIVAHEVSHGYAALALGDKTALYAGRLTMNPLKHIDPIGSIFVPILTSMAGIGFGWAKPVPYNPANLLDRKWGDTKVALAGPFTNLGIALAFAVLAHVGASALSPATILLVGFVVHINIVLAVFNLIPVPPFDGSKLLLNALPHRYLYVFDLMERYWFIVLLLLVYFAPSIIGPIVSAIYGILMYGL
jgi:Zn-dependent protease